MYCISCGNKLAEDSRFCEKCGRPCEDKAADIDVREERISEPIAKDVETEKNHIAGIQVGALWVQSFIKHIDDVMNKLELDKWQKAVSIIAACTVFSFLICITGNLEGWISAVAGIILFICCLKKKKINSMELAVTWTVFAMRFVITDVGALVSKYYVDYSLMIVVMRMLMYGTAVIYWLMIAGKLIKRQLANALILAFSSVMFCCTVIKFFMAFSHGFRSIVFYLGWSGFTVCYIIFFGRDEETIRYMKTNFNVSNLKRVVSSNVRHFQKSTVLSDADMKEGSFCAYCGKRLPTDAVFCENCGTKVKSSESENRNEEKQINEKDTYIEAEADGVIQNRNKAESEKKRQVNLFGAAIIATIVLLVVGILYFFVGRGAVITDFAIEGKWKNVGDDGFGQAQPGAIVAFDGTHCNYYSPYDAYAFYYDGSNYRLEVTGLLGDACSFTVNIVDNDNIEVIDNYGAVSLMRME